MAAWAALDLGRQRGGAAAASAGFCSCCSSSSWVSGGGGTSCGRTLAGTGVRCLRKARPALIESSLSVVDGLGPVLG